jgi:hypothetical protein
VVNGEMSLRRLKLSIYEVVTPREEEEEAEGGGGEEEEDDEEVVVVSVYQYIIIRSLTH